MEISDKLLVKYNIPVPRYTSYPPANHFSEEFTKSDYNRLLHGSNSDLPESVAIYIHIPFCKKICHYCGCNACAAGNGSLIRPYMDALAAEIKMVTATIDKTRRVSQIHYGGGTPNSIDVKYLQQLNDYFFTGFSFISEPEIAIECNPAYLDYNYIDALADAGFNRFSLGIQDFDERVLRISNREPSVIYPGELFNYLKGKKSGISVNFDFIYGLPGQTEISFAETMEKALTIRPDRLVTFSYAHVPWLKKHQLILERKGLPSPEEKMKMFLTSYEKLKDEGYKPVGLDHFVLEDDDLYKALKSHQLHRNFQGYCTRRTTGQVYAFGVTAISQLEKGYSQNVKEIDDYIRLINESVLPVERGHILNRNQIVTRDVINELMCNKRVHFGEIAEKNSITITELKAVTGFKTSQLDEMKNDGLLEWSEETVEVTERGSFFIRNIAALFDCEYQEHAKKYSRTV